MNSNVRSHCTLRNAVVVTLATIISGWGSASVVRARNLPRVKKIVTNRFDIQTIRLEDAVVGRTLVSLPAGDLVILHFPLRVESEIPLAGYLDRDLGNDQDHLSLYDEPRDSPWYIPNNDLAALSTFNCAAYTLGHHLGLGRYDWLEPLPSPWAGNRSAVDTMLNQFYRSVYVQEITEIDWAKWETDSGIREGDVVTFHDANEAYEVSHIARVIRKDGLIQLVSKLGRGPLAIGTPERTVKYYQPNVTQMRVFRTLDQ
ncbi:MAG: hypothetical protein WBD31_15325 [Rubripirellula sp.]